MPKVLIVEDDQILAGNIKEWLQSEKFSVDIAADGEQALHELRFYNYDVVVLDWMLPSISGLEICKEVRRHANSIPILMLTGKSDINEKETGLDAGADDYLTKPFHMRELTARLRALLRRQPHLVSSSMELDDIVLDLTNRRVTRIGQRYICYRASTLFRIPHEASESSIQRRRLAGSRLADKLRHISRVSTHLRCQATLQNRNRRQTEEAA